VLIWVDFPLRIVLWRLLKRTAQRMMTGEVFANGNRESFWRLLGPELHRAVGDPLAPPSAQEFRAASCHAQIRTSARAAASLAA